MMVINMGNNRDLSIYKTIVVVSHGQRVKRTLEVRMSSRHIPILYS